jgi:hypothetical protein
VTQLRSLVWEKVDMVESPLGKLEGRANAQTGIASNIASAVILGIVLFLSGRIEEPFEEWQAAYRTGAPAIFLSGATS